MAIGQAVLAPAVLDVAAVRRIEERVEDRERSRSVAHAEQLTDLLALERVYDDAGMALGATAEIALLLRCSEHRAGALLSDAQVLQRLGALPVMATGLLTVEQSRVVIDVLGRLDDVSLAASLWERLHLRLLADADRGVLLPPARLRELLQRWLLTADPDGAIARRKTAQRESQDVQVWTRDDGLVDIALRGVTGPNAQSCLHGISRNADPVGPYDERTEGQRRLASAVDLLTGRIALPFGEHCRPGCACGLGAEVPCGAQVYVHVPLPTILGASDEPAELVGHGPLDPDLLQQLLLAAPVLHRVWVDPETGVPIAVDDRTWHPPRRDPTALRQVLLDIASGPPPPPDRRHPVHPDDHPPPDPPDQSHAVPPVLPARAGEPRVLTRPHLTEPVPYRPSRRLRRLVRARAPRCEWLACGRRACHDSLTGDTPACDLDHDLPWPHGATCACNIGPLCRRHHRIKQLGWTKHRQPDGSVRWTSPTGRSWTTPAPHPVPRASRDAAPVHDDPRDALTQTELDRLMTELDPDGANAEAPEPQEQPAIEEPLRTTADLWTLLHDPTAWHDWPDPLEP